MKVTRYAVKVTRYAVKVTRYLVKVTRYVTFRATVVRPMSGYFSEDSKGAAEPVCRRYLSGPA